MSFESELQQVIDVGVGAGLKAFASDVDPEWVATAIARHCPAHLRNRKLPADSVVWLVVGMALFRDHSIADVVRRLDLVLPDPNGNKGTVVDGALPRARARVGDKALEDIFALSACHWAHDHAADDRWRDLAVYAMDGTSLSVPDTDENREAFRLPATGRGQSGYPKARLVTLMAARSHVIVDAAIGPFHGEGTGEPTLARPLWSGVPDHSLLIAHRNFIDYGEFHRFTADGTDRHWLFRMKRNLAFETVSTLGEGDELAELEISHDQRRRDDSLPRTMAVRVIHYEFDGTPQRLMTSLLDPDRWQADEVIAMYHEQWEVQTAYSEAEQKFEQGRTAADARDWIAADDAYAAAATALQRIPDAHAESTGRAELASRVAEARARVSERAEERREELAQQRARVAQERAAAAEAAQREAARRFSLGHFGYVLGRARQTSSVGSGYARERAQSGATFVVVEYTIENQSDRTRTVLTDNLVLIDGQNREFQPSSRAETALAMSGDDDFLITELQPGLARQATTAFEVPEAAIRDGYTIEFRAHGFNAGTKRFTFR